MTKRIAILISGGGSNMAQLIDSLIDDHPGRAVLVVSNVPGAGGLQKAEARGVPTATVDHRFFAGDRVAFEAALSKVLTPHQPDMLCQAGFMRILTPAFVTPWAGRMLNIHPSLLPKYKGLNTHVRALNAGDRFAGCSVHYVTPELDGGQVIGQAVVPILEGDDEKSLAARVLVKEHCLYPLVLRRVLEGNSAPVYLS